MSSASPTGDALRSSGPAVRVPTWHRRFWMEESPTKGGWLACLLFPVLFWLPFARVPFFPSWEAGAGTVAWLAMYLLTCALARQSGVARPSFIWLFQKGISIPAYAIRCWLWSVSAGLAVLCWWGLVFAIAAHFHGSAYSAGATYWSWLSTSYVVGTAGLFMLGSLRVRSTVEAWTGIAFLALLAPLISAMGPSWLARVLSAVLPPYAQLATLKHSFQDVTLGDGAALLGHAALFVSVALVIGIWRLGRWPAGRAS
jgi:hypothetical protein